MSFEIIERFPILHEVWETCPSCRTNHDTLLIPDSGLQRNGSTSQETGSSSGHWGGSTSSGRISATFEDWGGPFTSFVWSTFDDSSLVTLFMKYKVYGRTELFLSSKPIFNGLFISDRPFWFSVGPSWLVLGACSFKTTFLLVLNIPAASRRHVRSFS